MVHLTKIKIINKFYDIYVWNSLQDMNKYEEEIKRKYMAFPERYKINEDNPYGSDGFIVPMERKIHIFTKYEFEDDIYKNLAHEIAHAIFDAKDKRDYYEDERLIEACAETYKEIYDCVEQVKAVIESRKTHA